MNPNTSNLISHPFDTVEIIGYDNVPNKPKKKKRVLRRCKCKDMNDANKLCIACTEKVKDYVCYPCGHVCFCEECSQTFIACRGSDTIYNYCPVCRDYILKIVKIYF
jgi:hypothetical protein